jgi:phosphoglycolate phosphatase
MPGIKHVIWDWNGTLLDDAWLCVEILNELSRSRGLPNISLCDYRRTFGFPVIDFYKKLGFDFSKESFYSLSEDYIRLYNARRYECPLRLGCEDILSHLKEMGIGQSVLSAYNQAFLVETLEHFGLNGYFGKVMGLDNNLAHSKAEIGKLGIQELSCPLQEILLVGDTDHDFEVSREIGVACALVQNGHQSLERINACGVPVLSQWKELLKIVSPALASA